MLPIVTALPRTTATKATQPSIPSHVDCQHSISLSTKRKAKYITVITFCDCLLHICCVPFTVYNLLQKIFPNVLDDMSRTMTVERRHQNVLTAESHVELHYRQWIPYRGCDCDHQRRSMPRCRPTSQPTPGLDILRVGVSIS